MKVANQITKHEIAMSEKSRLRACMLCGLIKVSRGLSRGSDKDGPREPTRSFPSLLVARPPQSGAQFKSAGCDNCEQLLHYKNSSSTVQACTTDKFEGTIGIFQPENSWAARNLSVDKFAKGVYAIRVIGRLPEDVEERLRDEGFAVFARDGSSMD